MNAAFPSSSTSPGVYSEEAGLTSSHLPVPPAPSTVAKSACRCLHWGAPPAPSTVVTRAPPAPPEAPTPLDCTVPSAVQLLSAGRTRCALQRWLAVQEHMCSCPPFPSLLPPTSNAEFPGPAASSAGTARPRRSTLSGAEPRSPNCMALHLGRAKTTSGTGSALSCCGVTEGDLHRRAHASSDKQHWPHEKHFMVAARVKALFKARTVGGCMCGHKGAQAEVLVYKHVSWRE
eukprot:360331-Chlamydomonas_euryale.AAC.1